MDSKRIDTIIIGAGITGSVLSHFTNSLVIDKAKMAGGRCSTGRIDSNIFFDKGATMYKKSFAYYFNSKEKEFNLNEYLNNNFPLLKINKIYENMFIPETGMMSLVTNFIKKDNFKSETKVKKITKENDLFIVTDDLENKFIANNCFVTCPLPQTYEIIKELPFFEEWYEFSKKYENYKKTIVATGIWKGVKINTDSQVFISELNHNHDLEYYTIENLKYNKNEDLVISIQFSSKFSETFFDNWMDDNKNLNLENLDRVEKFFLEIFTKNKITYKKPDQVRAHRWKYSSPIVSMFDRDNKINFDSVEYKNYINLCEKHRLYITGDWIFGQRVPKCILGAIQLSSIFLGKNLLLEADS